MDFFEDRSWMGKRSEGPQIGLNPIFVEGVGFFLDYAYSHLESVYEGKIRCPCPSCRNGKYELRAVVKHHLEKKGFSLEYKEVWWAHGQRSIPVAAQVQNQVQNEDNNVYRRGGTKSQVHYMMEQESRSARTEGEGETPKDFAEMYVSLRSDLPGIAEQREEYQRLMREKYPEATGTLSFDEEVWTMATVQKKGYVKGIGQKRTRASTFSECTSASSTIGDSTATSAHNVEAQANDIIQAICHNPNLMESLRSTFLACFGPNGVQAAQGQSSQASGNNGPQEPPPPSQQ